VVLSLCSLDEDINAEVPRKGCVGASWRSAAACADIPEDPVRNGGIRRIMGVFPGIGIAEHRIGIAPGYGDSSVSYRNRVPFGPRTHGRPHTRTSKTRRLKKLGAGLGPHCRMISWTWCPQISGASCRTPALLPHLACPASTAVVPFRAGPAHVARQ